MRRFLSLRDFDWTLLAFVLLLCVISVFEIYSATQHTQFRHFQMHRMQMLWIAGGLVAMFIMSVIDYHKLLTIIYWIYGFCLAGLIAVLAVGTRVNGGKRWIKLPGGAHFQPSEWVKLVLILLVARYFSNLAGRELSWKDIFKAIGFVALPMLLVLKQPDMGTALTYTPVLLVGLFLGGIDWRKGSILVLVILLAVGGVWKSGKVLKPYQKGPPHQLPEPRRRSARNRLSDPAIQDRRRRRRCFRARRQPRHPDPGRFPPHPLHRLHFCRF